MSIEDRKNDKLPVTAEIGGEGGSYADATQQAETFKGATGNRRIDPKTVAHPDADATNAAAEGEQVVEDADAVKPATEPPDER